MTFSLSAESSHEHHDRLLIAGLVEGDAAGAERERALAQVATCDSCRDLLIDLKAIARAVASTPTISRPIGADFQITVRDARRLARGGWWRRALRPLGSTRGSILSPAAATIMTLGLAGLVLSAGSLLPIGAAGAAPWDAALGQRQAVSEPAPASSGGSGGTEDRFGTLGAPVAAPSVPADTPPPLAAGLPQSTAQAGAAGPTMSATPAAAAGPMSHATPRVATDATKGSPEGAHSPASAGDRGLLAIVSGLLLIAGVGLLLLRGVAVRSL